MTMITKTPYLQRFKEKLKMDLDDICNKLDNLSVDKNYIITKVNVGNINCYLAEQGYGIDSNLCNCIYHENKKGIICCEVKNMYSIIDDYDYSNRQFFEDLYVCIIKFI